MSREEAQRRAQNLKRILEARKSNFHPLTLLRLNTKAIANGASVYQLQTSIK